MKRVFTDPRFPGFEVHNHGDIVFTVYEISDGAMHEIDSFRTFSDHPQKLIPDQVAEKRARDYYDRMADEFAIRSEVTPDIEDTAPPAPSPNRVRGDGFQRAGPASMGDMMDKVLTHDDVIEAYEAAKQLPEGPEREQAMARVKSMASQMESSADELVRRLLE
jgi:hypothetical protein